MLTTFVFLYNALIFIYGDLKVKKSMQMFSYETTTSLHAHGIGILTHKHTDTDLCVQGNVTAEWFTSEKLICCLIPFEVEFRIKPNDQELACAGRSLWSKSIAVGLNHCIMKTTIV